MEKIIFCFIANSQSKEKPKVEEIIGKYVIASSNFRNASVKDVPLRIVSNPYHDDITRVKRIDVVSLITGIKYSIPFDLGWIKIYDSYNGLIEHCKKWLNYIVYTTKGDVKQIINKSYRVIDNSYSSDFTGKPLSICGKTVKILSVPFMITTSYNTERPCILIQDGEVIGRAFFMESCLV